MNLSFVKSPAGADPIIVEGLFTASPQRMFDAWTTPEDVKQWFGPGPAKLEIAEIDLHDGGRWRFVYGQNDKGDTHQLSGSYEEIEAPRRLAFTWTHTKIASNGETETTDMSRVTVTFEDHELGTFVRLVHADIKTEGGRNGVGGGWKGTFERLAADFGGTPI